MAPSAQNYDLCIVSCSSRGKLEVDKAQLSRYMRGKHREIQERVFEYFNSRPDLQTPVEILKDDHRELCWRQLLGLVREAGIKPFKYVAEDPAQYFAIAEAVGSVDISLGIKMGVQYRSYSFLFSFFSPNDSSIFILANGLVNAFEFIYVTFVDS